MNETLRIVLSYVVFFLYMGLVIVVGEALQKKFNLDKEMCRKGEHLATGLSWLICCFFTGASVHTLIINFIGLVLLAVITFGGLMKSVQREDADKSYGLFFFGLSTCVVTAITIFFNKDFYWFTGIAYYCMAFGDGLAPFTARWAKKHNPKITEKKTLVGTLTVFIVSSLSALVFSLACNLGLSVFFCVSLGALAACVELFSEKCTDNLTIVFSVFGYLVLNYYGLATPALQWALVLAFPLALLNGGSKALTLPANITAWLYVLVSSYFAGIPMLVNILVLYVLSAVVGKISHRIHRKRYGEKLSLSRNAVQILATAGVAMILSVAYYFTKIEVLLFAAFAVIAEEFADTVASDVGKLSKNMPRNILGFKRMTAKVSGGVSLLGTVSGLIGAGVATGIAFCFGVYDIKIYLILWAIAFVGIFIDSVLGAWLQVLYRCPVCGALTEKTVHCNESTVYEKGVKCIDNCAVNFLSGILTALLCALLFLL
ncbi:MAG: DUF92 domain-containing protein [Clostridia bacterium]|nr:DUF92 domain-containing protein [Clostridia bacterium]